MVLKMLKEQDSTQNESMEETTDDSENSSFNDEENISTEGGNAAWADCIANVLKSDKPRTKKTLILSRAKKLNQIKQVKKSYDFEIEGEEKKEEKPDKNELDVKLIEVKKEKHENKLKALKLRVKPSIKDYERERALKKVATRGVVQLFNAVRIQQKEIDKELQKAGPLDHRKDAVLNNIDKRKFLDVLMGGERAKSEFIDKPVKEEIKEENDDKNKSEWSVLRDDFMTNKKFKNWDEESEGSNNEDAENDSDSEESNDGNN